jgi:hypothetical protein
MFWKPVQAPPFENVCKRLRNVNESPNHANTLTEASTVTLETSGFLPLLADVERGHAGM